MTQSSDERAGPRFTKLSGSGNDFACFDARDGRLDRVISHPECAAHCARTLCHRAMGIGADGIIFACRPEVEGVADIGARFFEPDGSEAALCGNGTGCFVRWVTDHGWHDGELRILTPAGVVRGMMGDGAYVKVCITLPEDIRLGIELHVDGRTFDCDYAVTGVPHVVSYVPDVDAVDVAHDGTALRHHAAFGTEGANANFVQVLEEGRIAVRTFEFGVEAETLACGTGSTACAALAALRFGWDDRYFQREPVLVHARSGDVLRVILERDERTGAFVDACLETVVRVSYTGRLHPDLARHALCPDD